MAYLAIKWLHVVSATILFGTGIGIAFFKWYSDRMNDARASAFVLAIVVKADLWFTAPSVVVQLATGLWMVRVSGWSLHDAWLMGALILYSLVGVCWLPVLWLQYRMLELAREAATGNSALTARYHLYRRWWTMLGVPAFAAILVIFYLMIFKPR